MPYCTSCGSSIPEGQGRSCSMCYGDPNHGRDGYYQKWLDDQAQEAAMREEEQKQQQE